MLRRTALTRFAVPAAAALVAGLSIPVLYATADDNAAEQCVQAGNVWIHVAYDDTVTGACATEFATAQDAIDNTGVSSDQGWIQTVDGRLAEDPEWWSVYTLSPSAEGTYDGAWHFAEVGVAELELGASDVLALQLQDDWEVDAVPPAVNPVDGVVLGEDEPTTPAPTTPAPTTPAPTTPAPVAPGMPETGH